MARTVRGKLKQDIRINHEGKEDGAGRLFLKGEFVSLDDSLADKVDTKAKPPVRRRTPYPFLDKQAGPSKSSQAEIDALKKRNAELEAKLGPAK